MTIQGEGVDQGTPCYFIRTGGCDFKCQWCDTPYAVLPHAVRATQRLTTEEILGALDALPKGPRVCVISGGNPALHALDDLVMNLHAKGLFVTCETQGTLFKSWMEGVDRMCVSPKPPSSEMRTDWQKLDKVISYSGITSDGPPPRVFLKVVVFDSRDYEYAKKVHKAYPYIPFYVSAGNDAGQTVGNPSRVDRRTDAQVREQLVNRGRWLANRVMVDPDMADVTCQMQQHVLYWANQRGV